MDKESKLKILALLEAHRLYANSKQASLDFALRVCVAIVAKVLGYDNRADWTDEIQKLGLIDYSYGVDTKQQYFELTDMVNDIKIQEVQP